MPSVAHLKTFPKDRLSSFVSKPLLHTRNVVLHRLYIVFSIKWSFDTNVFLRSYHVCFWCGFLRRWLRCFISCDMAPRSLSTLVSSKSRGVDVIGSVIAYYTLWMRFPIIMIFYFSTFRYICLSIHHSAVLFMYSSVLCWSSLKSVGRILLMI